MIPRALVLALVAATALRLLPPGWGDKRPAHDSTHLAMPAALAHGSRVAQQPEALRLHAVVSPAPARLGQQLVYRAFAYAEHGEHVTIAPPEGGGDFTWGDFRAGSAHVAGGHADAGWSADSVWIEVPLQIFRTGRVGIPGAVVRVQDQARMHAVRSTRLPTVELLVLPTVSPADTAATLRPVHGPLGAPWWEQVPWRIVFAVAVALLVIVGVLRRLLRRKPVAPSLAPRVASAPGLDPTAEALKSLAELRKLDLPAQARFGEHALVLTRILRRFLERTLGTPRPGDTRTELLVRLRASRLSPDDVSRLEGLLGLWDRVKFARAPLDEPEARRCEQAVELFVRARETPREVA